mmetsp:Transcript_46834/g.109261  ORF Transcript_46834/g.109261 Transcript_46834/m.109261 type:complete len:212 (+) Transcript_46834:803-1438(+)
MRYILRHVHALFDMLRALTWHSQTESQPILKRADAYRFLHETPILLVPATHICPPKCVRAISDEVHCDRVVVGPARFEIRRWHCCPARLGFKGNSTNLPSTKSHMVAGVMLVVLEVSPLGIEAHQQQATQNKPSASPHERLPSPILLCLVACNCSFINRLLRWGSNHQAWWQEGVASNLRVFQHPRRKKMWCPQAKRQDCEKCTDTWNEQG